MGSDDNTPYLKEPLAKLSSLLLELFDGMLIDATALVDQVSVAVDFPKLTCPMTMGGMENKETSDGLDGLNKMQTKMHQRR